MKNRQRFPPLWPGGAPSQSPVHRKPVDTVTYPNHRIQGGGYAMADLPLLDSNLIDGYLKVSDEQAIDMARRLAREEGIFAGFSSGANVAAALELLTTDFGGKTAVVLICDSGLKYLSTDLWNY